MPASTRSATDFIPDQLRFPSIPGYTVRADFAGGELSSDLGPVVLGAVDRRIGMISKLTAAIADTRDQRYITHTMHDLLTQRVFQLASGYPDGSEKLLAGHPNDADTLRRDPMFKLAANKAPLDADNPLACGATHSRLENALSSKDIYRMARALVLQFIAGYSSAPASITLDLDHTADITHGQQELSFYNHHYGNYCYLPLLVFEAGTGALVTAVLRPGKRPTGAENAMIMKRILGLLRQHWPLTHILVRGDGHFSNPELMQLILDDGNADFLFGLPGNAVLSRKAEGLMKNARGHLDLHCALAAQKLGPAVSAVQMFGEFEYAAKSWSQAHRVVLKAEVLAGTDGAPNKDNERFVVTSLHSPTPKAL